MSSLLEAEIDPWQVELLIVRGHSHAGGERRALTRDVERGLLIRLSEGAYVERSSFEGMSPEAQHIVRMRALTETSDAPIVFSHWSAAILHGLPVLRTRLQTAHVTWSSAGNRGRRGVSGHVFRLDPNEVVRFGAVLATELSRTVVDVAGSSTFEEGVMAADAALHAGTPRERLEAAADLAGPRNAAARIEQTIAFADPGSESAAESRSRVTMCRIGVEPPVLQYRIVLADGSVVFLDFEFPSFHVGGEADGDSKFLDPTMVPQGAGHALIKEKRREDEVRAGLNGLARWGWVQSGNVALLRGVLARAGVVASRPRATLADYIARAREGRARFVPRRRT